MTSDDYTFSFRMFDLYRRFVAILQTNKEYLKEFKTGYPKEETCRAIITKTFQHRQPDNKVSEMIGYLHKNAHILVAHAENTPATWDTAVRFTDWCISEIKRYLKRKGISFKSNFEAVKDISNEIGKCIYRNGANPKQIKIIEDYLREDLRNPKRPIKRKEKILSSISEKENEVGKIENEESNSIATTDVQDESNDVVQIITPSNGCQEFSVPQNFFKEDLLKTEFSEEIQDFLQPQGYMSANELLHIASPGESNEFVLDKNDLNQLQKSDKTVDAEDIQSILESLKCENEDNDLVILKVNGDSDTSTSKAEYSSNTAPSNYCLTLKRKNSFSNDSANCLKKLFITNEAQYKTVNTDDENDSIQYVTVNTDDNIGDNTCNSVQIIETTEKKIIQIDEDNESNFEINIDCKLNDDQNNQSEIQNGILDECKIEVEPEIKEESPICFCKTEFKNISPYTEETVKYSDIMKLTYTEVKQMMEKMLAFCEIKNEISLEEFLVLRRTKDKMHWRSLEENKDGKRKRPCYH